MSDCFRIGWSDRLRGLLTGRVRSVHAESPPVVFRSNYGGASYTIDDDAFGFGDGRADYSPRGGPYLTVEVPDALREMACPCCRQIVNIDRIQKPHPADLALWRQLKRMMPAPEAP